MRRTLRTIALSALLAVASTSCAGNPANQPTPMPGPRVTTNAPSPHGVQVAYSSPEGTVQ